jgi:heat shock protein HtpX
MKRSFGRDLGLSVRMGVALTLVALIYLGAEAILLLIVVSGAREGDWAAVLAGLAFTPVIALLLVAQLRKSEELLLRKVRAKVLDPGERPELQEVVARVAAQANLPRPRVAVIHSWAPNALTAARSPATAVVAVTTELLRRLEPHELEAVIAHELAHVANRDGPVMTFVGGPAMVGSHIWREDKFEYLFMWIYWPIHLLGLLLLWTVSRYREYVADHGSALITGAPENLISALLAIEGERPPRSDLRGGLAVQAFCIVPRRSKWRRLELVMDHPPMRKRIERLEELSRELGKARL